MEDDNSSSYSLKQRIKNSILFSCCFGRPKRHNYLPSPPSPSDDNPSLFWVKPNENENAFSEIKDKCKSLLGISSYNNHRKHSSMEYNYDPLSYSLNFEDGFEKDESAPLKNFCARLPPSPPLAPLIS